MRVTNYLFGLSILIGLAIATPSADAGPTCQRWENNIQGCDFASFTDCNNLTSKQQITVNNWKYADTAEDACRKFFQKKDNYTGPVQLAPFTTPEVECLRQDANGVFNPNFKTYVRYPTIQKDACCSRTPNGPYRNLGTSAGTEGATFSTSQKDNILALNFSRSNSTSYYMSDAGDNDVPGYVYPLEIDVTYLAKNVAPIWVRPPQVDHIIPRLDSHGCGCGTNSFANALVISSVLNVSMTNDCSNEDRLDILDAYSY